MSLSPNRNSKRGGILPPPPAPINHQHSESVSSPVGFSGFL